MNTNQGPDCLTCWRRNICPQAEEGKFCALYQSKEPKPQGENPADRWERGEDMPNM